MKKIERAIISVTDKSGVVEFARSLAKYGWYGRGHAGGRCGCDRYLRVYGIS